jgi:thiosulfate reductase cytochrome b subunit
MKREYVYQAFERFWHWGQAILIMLLGVTGFEIHGTIHFFGFRQAVAIHSTAAIAFLILVAFAIFWHVTTGEWKQYLPTREHLRAQINYYIFGIFKGAPHPTKKHVLSKLNPLQKIVYAGLKVLVIPVMGISGLLYMFYRYPQQYEVISLNISGLKTIALLHTAGAFALVCFFIAHLYLITTGSTVTSNLKAMITGYEDLPEHQDEQPKAEPQQNAAVN